MEPIQATTVFRALGEPVRLRVLRLLAGGERCACELLDDLAISQSTLSHHMKVLLDAGLVAARKDAVWVHYSIRGEGLAELRAFVEGLDRPEASASEAPQLSRTPERGCRR